MPAFLVPFHIFAAAVVPVHILRQLSGVSALMAVTTSHLPTKRTPIICYIRGGRVAAEKSADSDWRYGKRECSSPKINFV